MFVSGQKLFLFPLMLCSRKGSASAALPFFDSLNYLRDLEGCYAGFGNRVVLYS
jgi:hypothetical protein